MNIASVVIEIKEIKDEEDLVIYHQHYDYNLYKDKFNKYLRVKYVAGDYDLETILDELECKKFGDTVQVSNDYNNYIITKIDELIY